MHTCTESPWSVQRRLQGCLQGHLQRRTRVSAKAPLQMYTSEGHRWPWPGRAVCWSAVETSDLAQTRAMPRPTVAIGVPCFHHPLVLGQAGPGRSPLESQQLPWCGPGFCWQFSSAVLYALAVGIQSIKTLKFLILLDLRTQKHLLRPPHPSLYTKSIRLFLFCSTSNMLSWD